MTSFKSKRKDSQTDGLTEATKLIVPFRNFVPTRVKSDHLPAQH